LRREDVTRPETPYQVHLADAFEHQDDFLRGRMSEVY
jgi:hypothetical protein